MRISKFHLATVKEVPNDAEIASHRLMVRAGMIHKHGAGLYTWSPLGLRVLRKVSQVVREEMDAAGALEVSMPPVQPARLWQESGRWSKYGAMLLKMSDRKGNEFCYGPTHEEMITDFARSEIKSYKQLPINFYQIQTKFRDEIRPRFGVMRAREFLMKDAYSFHLTPDSLAETYEAMFDAYSRIFTRLKLRFRPVEADNGDIGGDSSHEFHVLAGSGEDAIAVSDTGTYAANVEMAEALAPAGDPASAEQDLETVDTPGQHTIEEVSKFLDIPADQTLKTLIVEGPDGELVALVLRGDHQLNEIKAGKLAEVSVPLTFATDEQVKSAIGCAPGSIGPIGLDMPVIADRSAAHLSDFVCGANLDDKHYRGANWSRDTQYAKVADLRNAETGDPSPDGNGTLEIVRGIEVGHIFQLGTKYSESMNAVVLNDTGRAEAMWMGCYGIGVSRIVAAAIEQNHDEHGIIWPQPMAPFQVALLPMNMHKSQRLREAVDGIYEALQDAGVDVLLDDRKVRPGVMFADMELIGIPHRVVIGERGLDRNMAEYRARGESENHDIPLDQLVDFLAKGGHPVAE